MDRYNAILAMAQITFWNYAIIFKQIHFEKLFDQDERAKIILIVRLDFDL